MKIGSILAQAARNRRLPVAPSRVTLFFEMVYALGRVKLAGAGATIKLDLLSG